MRRPRRRNEGVYIPHGIGGWEAHTEADITETRRILAESRRVAAEIRKNIQSDDTRLKNIEWNVREMCTRALADARHSSAAAFTKAADAYAMVRKHEGQIAMLLNSSRP